MSNVVAASNLLKETWCVGNVEARIRQASIDLRWPFSRVWNLWYGKVRRIDGHEWDELRALARQEQRETADEHRKTSDRLARLEAMVEQLLAAQSGAALAEAGALARREIQAASGSRHDHGAGHRGR